MSAPELPPLPEPRMWYDHTTGRCSHMIPVGGTNEALFDVRDLEAHGAACAAAAERALAALCTCTVDQRNASEALRAALAAPAVLAPAPVICAVRAKYADGIEVYLDVRGVYDLGGKLGIDVQMPGEHESPAAAMVRGEAQPSAEPVTPHLTPEQREALATVLAHYGSDPRVRPLRELRDWPVVRRL